MKINIKKKPKQNDVVWWDTFLIQGIRKIHERTFKNVVIFLNNSLLFWLPSPTLKSSISRPVFCVLLKKFTVLTTISCFIPIFNALVIYSTDIDYTHAICDAPFCTVLCNVKDIQYINSSKNQNQLSYTEHKTKNNFKKRKSCLSGYISSTLLRIIYSSCFGPLCSPLYSVYITPQNRPHPHFWFFPPTQQKYKLHIAWDFAWLMALGYLALRFTLGSKPWEFPRWKSNWSLYRGSRRGHTEGKER